MKLTSIFQNVKSEITEFKCVSFPFLFNFGNGIGESGAISAGKLSATPANFKRFCSEVTKYSFSGTAYYESISIAAASFSCADSFIYFHAIRSQNVSIIKIFLCKVG